MSQTDTTMQPKLCNSRQLTWGHPVQSSSSRGRELEKSDPRTSQMSM